MSDDEEEREPLEFDESDRMTRAQVARRLGVHAKTVERMWQDGDLERDDNKYFSRQQVESLTSDEKEDRTVQALKLQIEHNERFMQLLEKPLKVATETMIALTERLTKRDEERDNAYLQNMQMMGEMMLQKEEREILRMQAEAKAELLKNTGSQILNMLPILLSQFAAGKRDPVTAFFNALDDEERTQLLSLGELFEGEKKALFDAMVKGIKKPSPPEEKAEKSDGN